MRSDDGRHGSSGEIISPIREQRGWQLRDTNTTENHESPGILHKVRERGVEESFKVGFSRLSQVPTSDT